MIRTTGLILTLALLGGCAASAQGPALSVDHPAHPEATSMPPHPVSETLTRAQHGEAADPQPHTPAEAAHAVPAAFEQQIGELLRAYYDVADALADDGFEQAHAAMARVQAQLASVDAAPLNETQRAQWIQIREPLSAGVERFLAADGIEPARAAFDPVSGQLAQAVRRFGSGGDTPVHVMHCPMAFDNRGADWLQPEAQVKNPYYGARMLRCGSATETIAGSAGGASGQNQTHNHLEGQ